MLVMLVAAIAAFAALMPATAGADVTPTVSTNYEPTTVPGGNGLYSITQSFQYGALAEPQPGTEDLKKWIIDSPAGLIGNPNAVPFEDRCTAAEFAQANPFSPSTCPAASKVGTAQLNLVTDALSGAVPGGSPMPSVNGNIYILQTSPEVPTTLATQLNSAWYQNVGPPYAPSGNPCETGHDVATGGTPCPIYIKTRSIVQPVTTGINGANDGDFRLRTIPAEDSTRPFTFGPTTPAGNFAVGPTPLHIRTITYNLDADAGNGNPFIQYPTNMGPWKSLSYATAWDANTNSDADPDPDPALNLYKTSTNVDEKTPSQVLPSFPSSSTMSFSTLNRGSNPEITVDVKGINSLGDDYPKKVVNTLPASVNVDNLHIPADICEAAQRDSATCPASSLVGTATGQTPLLTAGLSGVVYMVRGAGGKAVPDLAIYFDNPPNSIRPFRLDGATRYAGPNNNQIETTFDNNPQNPITSFKLTINGGANGLMKITECPSDTASPPDGPVTFNLTGFSGQTAASASTPAFADCFGVRALKKISRCVKTKLKVSPSYQSRDQLMKSELWVKYKTRSRSTGKIVRKYKRVQRVKSSPFRFNKKLSAKKFKKGTYRYKVRAVYKPSTNHPSPYVTQRYSKFKYCGK